MRKIIASIRFLFRPRLEISSESIKIGIKDFQYLLTKNDIVNYNDAVSNGAEDDVLTRIHPLFYTKISWRIIENLNKHLEQAIDEGILKTIVHQSEYIIFHEKLQFPAKLTVKSKIWSLRRHKKGTKMLIRFDYFAADKHIATEYSGGLLFGVKLKGKDKSLGGTLKNKRVDETVIWSETLEIARDLPYTYATKAEIDAPIHTNPKFAKSIGLPDIILQGTCTFAKSTSLILFQEFGENIPEIKSVAAKFTGMIVPPDKITVRVLKKEGGLLHFDVLNNKNKAVIKAGQIAFI